MIKKSNFVALNMILIFGSTMQTAPAMDINDTIQIAEELHALYEPVKIKHKEKLNKKKIKWPTVYSMSVFLSYHEANKIRLYYNSLPYNGIIHLNYALNDVDSIFRKNTIHMSSYANCMNTRTFCLFEEFMGQLMNQHDLDPTEYDYEYDEPYSDCEFISELVLRKVDGNNREQLIDRMQNALNIPLFMKPYLLRHLRNPVENPEDKVHNTLKVVKITNLGNKYSKDIPLLITYQNQTAEGYLNLTTSHENNEKSIEIEFSGVNNKQEILEPLFMGLSNIHQVCPFKDRVLTYDLESKSINFRNVTSECEKDIREYLKISE